SFAFVRAINPQRLARSSVSSDDKPALIHREIEDAVDHDGRCFASGLRVRHKTVRLPDPGNSKVFNIVAIDLIQSTIMRASVFAAVHAPFTGLRSLLRNDRMDPKQ